MELYFDYRPSNNHWAKVMAKEMIDNEVLSIEESKDILDNCKSDMKRIHVIADIFK